MKPLSVQMWALPPPLPSPWVAEPINVVSERAHLKERYATTPSTARTNANTTTVKSVFIGPPFVRRTVSKGGQTVIGEFADPGGRNY